MYGLDSDQLQYIYDGLIMFDQCQKHMESS